MTTEKMFETAVRDKIRFGFRGQISVEDLWDLSVEDLDTVYKGLNSQLKQLKEDSLLDKRTKQDEVIDLKISIIKHIVSVKQEEAMNRLKAKEVREKRDKILKIMASKQDAELESKDLKELEEMLDSLE